MEKVKLPKEVADAIETLRSMDFKVTNWDIVYTFTKDENYPELGNYANNHTDNFFKALVNGYEVEETPEDLIRTYFNKQYELVNKGWGCDKPTTAISYVLDTLNIQIEGVNT